MNVATLFRSSNWGATSFLMRYTLGQTYLQITLTNCNIYIKGTETASSASIRAMQHSVSIISEVEPLQWHLLLVLGNAQIVTRKHHTVHLIKARKGTLNDKRLGRRGRQSGINWTNSGMADFLQLQGLPIYSANGSTCQSPVPWCGCLESFMTKWKQAEKPLTLSRGGR